MEGELFHVNFLILVEIVRAILYSKENLLDFAIMPVLKKEHKLIFSPLPFGLEILQVVSNQEAVDIAKGVKDPRKAAKQLTAEALKRDSKDDISCVVVRFRA